jgi:two-component system response regulator AtoC
MNTKVFIIEDDPIVTSVIKQSLIISSNCDIYTFENAEESLKNLHQNPDIVILDYNLPDEDGFSVMTKIKSYSQNIQVVICSGQEKADVVLKCLNNGANGYVFKDEMMIEYLRKSVSSLSENAILRKEVEVLKDQIIDRNKYSNIIGNSKEVLKVLRLIQKVEKNNMTVLVTGQSGTGKELVAKALHYNSNRSRKPFVIVNMGAIPTDLVESELFGHEKGAFTDAREKRIGKFEEADGGTIFLDEIGEMDLSLQTKLLRVLQEKEVTRIGSNKIMKLDFRLIAATNKNMLHEVKEGRFREDLFYRLQGFLIHLPPLKERDDDIILLGKSFLSDFCKENKMPQIQLSKDACSFMLDYDWPGNIRELKAVIERAALMAEDNIITVEDLTFVNA